MTDIRVFLDWGDGFVDVSTSVKYDTLTYTHNAFSTSYKYAQNECSFDLIYTASIFAGMLSVDASDNITLRIIDMYSGSADDFIADENLFFTCEDDGIAKALFYGHIPHSNSWTYNGITDNTMLYVNATDDLDLLDVTIGESIIKDSAVLDPENPTASIAHYLLFAGNWGDDNVYESDFSSDVDSWVINNGTLEVTGDTLKATYSGDGGFISRSLDSISGEDNPFIYFDFNTNNNDTNYLRVYYATDDHSYSDLYYKDFTLYTSESEDYEDLGTWNNCMLDMSNLDVGDTDWTDNDITGIKFQLMNTLADGTTQLANMRIGNVTRLVDTVTIDTVIDRVAVSDSDTPLDILDTMFYEYGYALSCNAMGYISPVKWAIEDTDTTEDDFTESNIVEEISADYSVRQYDGVKTTYYTMSSADDIRLYTDDNCSYDDDGTFDGYSILADTYYPPEANATDTDTGELTVVEQTYTTDGISYATNYAITNDLDYDYTAFDSDFSAIVSTENHYMDRSYTDGLTISVQAFGNETCRLLYKNDTDTTKTLWYNNVYGTVYYKSSSLTKEIDLVSSPVNLYSYNSSYIYDSTDASYFTTALAELYNTGKVTYTFNSESSVSQGTHTNVTTDLVTNETLVRVVTYDNGDEMYTYKCISCGIEGLTITNTTNKSITTVSKDDPYVVSFTDTSISVPYKDSAFVLTNAYTTINVKKAGVNYTDFFTISCVGSDGITVSNVDNVYSISALDSSFESGTLTFTCTKTDDTSKIYVSTVKVDAGVSGADGAAGADGADGADGYSYTITTDNGTFVKSRSGTVSPSTVTVSAHKVAESATTDYSGRFIIYTTTDGETYSSVYISSANESSHTYTIASSISGMRIELYLADGTTTLLASSDYDIPYSEDVAPSYLGVGTTEIDTYNYDLEFDGSSTYVEADNPFTSSDDSFSVACDVTPGTISGDQNIMCCRVLEADTYDLEFDGSSTYVEADNPFTESGAEWRIEGEFNADDISETQNITCCRKTDNSYGIALWLFSGVFTIYAGNTIHTTDYTATANTDTPFKVSGNANGVSLYIDDVLTWSDSVTGVSSNFGSVISIGASQLGGSTFRNYFAGTIKNIRIYDSLDTSSLTNEWLLTEGSGTTASDTAGSLDGTIYNGAWNTYEGCDETGFSIWSLSGYLNIDIARTRSTSYLLTASTTANICIAADSGALNVYIDGSLYESITTATTLSALGTSLTIGVDNDDGTLGSSYFDGTIKNVRIYSDTLTAAQALSLSEGTAVTDNLTNEWLLTEGSGTIANDTVGSLDGTIYNGTWDSTSSTTFDTSTKAIISATVDSNGTITVGSTNSNIISGDSVLGYESSGLTASVYVWDGSEWTETTEQTYVSSAAWDILNLTTGGYTVTNYTVIQDAIIKNLMVSKLYLLTNGVFYGGSRFDEDGTEIDTTSNGFWMNSDGDFYGLLQSFTGYNVLAGTDAGKYLTVGDGDLGKYNVCTGHQAGLGGSTSEYYNCVFNGYKSGYSNLTGYGNNFQGAYSGYSNTTGSNNNFGGYRSGYSNTTGSNNTFGGYQSGYHNTSGRGNTFGGTQSGYSNTTGDYNTFGGTQSGYYNTTGEYNVFNGMDSGGNNTTGDHNVAIGASTDLQEADWDYQVNINNRLSYIEFSSSATENTVYDTIQLVAGTSETDIAGFGLDGSTVVDGKITYVSSTSSYTIGATSCVNNSSSTIGHTIQLWIVPKKTASSNNK